MSSDALGITPALESEREERKESWQENGLEALAAFANTRGGTLWIGVKDNGDPVEPGGWSDAGVAGRMEAIINKIVSKLGVHPASVTIETVKGKPVLAIQMNAAPAPISLDGHYWRRVGNTSRRIPAEELQRFLLERTGTAWDSLPCDEAQEALSEEAFARFKAQARKRLPAISPEDSPERVLDNLELRAQDGRLRRAAVMLFGRDRAPQRLNPTAFVKMGRFKDSTTILDDKEFGGNLFEQLDAAMQQFRQYLQVRYEFRKEMGDLSGLEAMQRIEIWDYPLDALREAVANALLHRDYTDFSSVMVRVYDDRVLISSPGLLPAGVTLEDLTTDPHRSRPRNPLLAQAFFLTEIVEKWGTGTLRMARLCAEQGLPAPEFAEVSGEFWVTFRKDPYTDERLRALGLSDRQIQAVRYVQERGSISNAAYRSLVGVSDETARQELRRLVTQGLLRAEGRGRSAQYVLAKAGE